MNQIIILTFTIIFESKIKSLRSVEAASLKWESNIALMFVFL